MTKRIIAIKIAKRVTAISMLLILILNLLDAKKKIIVPVENATEANWDKDSYWYYPWRESVVHRGIDIFGDLNTKIISPVSGIVIESSYSKNGGNYIYILASDLKIYYFAHLNKRNVNALTIVRKNNIIGFMGDTGNAKFAPFHLHFSIYSMAPIFRYFDLKAFKGWQKMFYLNPINYFPNK